MLETCFPCILNEYNGMLETCFPCVLNEYNVTLETCFPCELNEFNVTLETCFPSELNEYNVTLETCFFCELNEFNVSLETCFPSELNEFNVSLETCFPCELNEFNVSLETCLPCELNEFNVSLETCFPSELNEFNVSLETCFPCVLNEYNGMLDIFFPCVLKRLTIFKINNSKILQNIDSVVTISVDPLAEGWALGEAEGDHNILNHDRDELYEAVQGHVLETAKRAYLISVVTHSMLLIAEVKGAATEASASDREIPAWAAFRASQSLAPSPHIPTLYLQNNVYTVSVPPAPHLTSLSGSEDKSGLSVWAPSRASQHMEAGRPSSDLLAFTTTTWSRESIIPQLRPTLTAVSDLSPGTNILTRDHDCTYASRPQCSYNRLRLGFQFVLEDQQAKEDFHHHLRSALAEDIHVTLPKCPCYYAHSLQLVGKWELVHNPNLKTILSVHRSNCHGRREGRLLISSYHKKDSICPVENTAGLLQVALKFRFPVQQEENQAKCDHNQEVEQASLTTTLPIPVTFLKQKQCDLERIMQVDTLIVHGRVIDPLNDVDKTLDVAIKDGKVFKVGENLNVAATETFDATGCLVTPGLIDAHVHCYEYATPISLNADKRCLSRGVTTVIDAGSSGASTFMGLRKYVMERSKTRVKCLLHIAMHGLASAGLSAGAGGGESDTLAILDEDSCVKCIQDNRDVIVGVKTSVPWGRQNMRHIDPSAKLCCPGDLRPGDIYTHTYVGYPSTIVDAETRDVYSDVMDAKSRGVLFDVGHGAGGFNWTVAEIACKQNLYPDLLGTDLHVFSQDGPAYDLPSVMTKFLHIGMPLYDVVKSVTSAPALAYGITGETGSLTTGIAGDVTILKIDDCDFMLEDSVGQLRNIRRIIRHLAVWREGERIPVTFPKHLPSEESQQRSLKNLKDQEVKD
ncbi:DEACT-like protein [Mya arenaria]|uniref:DEACT-like protein n=1 Tax=Mya arenaria TaxID=6604 RepID=A0ABY7EX77_MYAAR|nr:DEACT-like protein [Mya arenaria]